MGISNDPAAIDRPSAFEGMCSEPEMKKILTRIFIELGGEVTITDYWEEIERSLNGRSLKK